ncbi:MAG: metal-sulfur cluster assembly factor [Patescibacteria group bacterium]|jgi:metal-sulfur cluster biosynthetic enzyme
MKKLTEKDVKEVLHIVHDPELQISIVDLGLIYDVQISDTNDVIVKMTVTTPGCPIIDQFLEQAHDKIESLKDVGNVTVKLTFDPPWTPDRIKPEIREALGI